ncbi:Fc.00g113790.m01.CDS01 [Cosmosporella sp. VM-42]
MDTTGLSILNQRATRLSGPCLLHKLVKLASSLPALDYMGNNQRFSLTYQQLHDAADVLAIRISRYRASATKSNKSQFVVPVLIHQSPLLYISLLAILKAGGAFCPLNIDAPPERVKFILQDVSATVVLVSKELASEIPQDGSPTILIVDEEEQEIKDGSNFASSKRALDHRVPSREDLAYVMYTSGSTGTPKGVGISHDAATQALLAHDRHIPPFSRFLQFAAPTFDVSVFEIFFPLFRGNTLVTIRRVEMLNDLPAVLRAMDVDACELTPTVVGSLLRKRENAPELKLLLTIGEMLNAPVVAEFGGDDKTPSMLWAMYGPTEATIHCTLQAAFSSRSSTGTIGAPLDTVSCFIIEPADSGQTSSDIKILPQGEVGELAVGGHQLATGYINRPEQTSSAFISSPYGRIYRTGDKARLLPDGTLECLGRLSDGQVKLRGQRLELGEVEQAVLRTSGCHSAVAAVVRSILVVFCAVDVGVSEDEVLIRCRDWLPQFMVPGEVILMEAFPRLPSGKVDRKKLKADYEQQKTDWITDTMDSNTADEVETKVTALVSEVMNLRVNRSTPLAAAGLDSLRAIKLASTLRESHFDLSSSSLLAMKSVSDIVFAVRSLPNTAEDSLVQREISLKSHLDEILVNNSALEGLAELIEDVIPCIPSQSAMLAETAQNATAYCNEIELEIASEYTAELVSAAFQELVHRTEILRSGFAIWRGRFVSLIFKEFRKGQIGIVDDFQPTFIFSTPEDYLRPLQIQISRGNSTTRSRVLIHIHHSIYDGWSLDILLSDLSKLLAGQEVTPRSNFSEVTRFYSSHQSQEFDDDAKSFWAEHLLGWNKAPLPKLHPQACASKQIGSSRTRLQISRQTVDNEIRGIGYGAQVLFQASLALLWSGILGVSDVVIGSVTSGRTIPVAGIERIIGPCIASLPLRVDSTTMTANLDLLNSIQSNNRKIMKYCHLPLSEIKNLVGLQPGESLYDVLFAYQESLDSHSRPLNVAQETRHLDRLETPLLFEIEPADGGYNLHVTYQSSLFPSEAINQLVQQFDIISLNLAQNAARDIQTIRRDTNFHRSVHNPVPRQFRGDSDLAKGFERAVVKQPSNTALCFASSLTQVAQTTSLSFGELNEVSNQLGWYLHSIDIKAGQVVAIIMDKSPSLYISMLAVVKAGCAYLPILPSTPAARIEEILKQAGVVNCLVDGASLPSISSIGGTDCIDVDTAPLSDLSRENLNVPADPSRLAYIIYTSGTTGVPKGVAVTQHNINANISDLIALYPLDSRSEPRLLQSCSQAFDVSVFEIFFTWHAGMCLCAGTNDTIFEDLEHAIRQLNITHLSLTPTVASLIDPRHAPTVQFLITAGEPLTQPVLDKWGDLLWQGYGPSETTNICTVKRMAHGDHVENLGHALPNTSTFVLFPNNCDIVPLGWVGELCFGGEQVAQGYLKMPELTEERFIHHPQHGRLYRTGDTGRMLPDGSLVILGRMDDQVKLRGQRIETSEINSVATSLDVACSAMTLLVQRTKEASSQLALFYVPQRDTGDFHELEVIPESHRSLLAAFQSRLPAYMIPSYLIPVSEIPLSPSGKADQRRLQACFQDLSQKYLEAASGTSHDTDDQTCWSDSETLLADIISAATGTSRKDFGRWTPLALLGVDSVSAIELARQINLRFNVRIAISAILKNQTIAQLARHLMEAPQMQTEMEPTQFFPQSFIATVSEAFEQESKLVTGVLPCTPLQEAMLSRGQKSYYNRILLRLHVEPEVMKSYWTTMTQRHDILRTCFITTTEAQRAIAQVVINDWDIPWLTFDVRQPSFDVAIHEHLRSLPDPIDSKIPPVSIALIRYRGSVFLSFICHHALYDGVAMGNLWKEVEGLARGTQLLPPVQYSQFLRAALELPEDVEQFWARQFHDHHPSSLFAQGTASEIDQCTHTTSLEFPLTELYIRTRNLGVSLLSLCQASWANVLALAHNRLDICFGNVVSGRTLNVEGLDRLVAPCFNTIPIRADMTRKSSNLELVKHFQTLNTDLMPYQFTPLRRIQRIKPLQNIDKEVWTLEEDSGEMDIPLVCEVVPCPALNSLVINIHRDMSMVTGETATVMAESFKLLLKATLNSPHTTLMDRKRLPIGLSSGFDMLRPRYGKFEAIVSDPTGQEQWSQIETQVRQVLAELSGVPEPQVHRHTTIFQLGLDSINAVQVASMLRQRGFNASASDVIECPSCSKIAAKLLESSERRIAETCKGYDFETFSHEVSSQLEANLPNSAEVEALLPCTRVQSAMLAASIQSDGDYYLNAVSYVIDEGIRVEDVAAAWKSIQTRHPMLRTGFLPVHHRDTSFSMVRYHPMSNNCPLELLEERDGEDLSLLKRRKDMGSTLQASLHLPPWKVLLVRKSSQLTMNLIMHHALYDAPSLRLILDDVSRLLQGHPPQAFAKVEPALSIILRKSATGQEAGKEFWQAKANQTVVNRFPVMTPLRVEERVVLSETSISSLSFSRLRQATQSSNVSIQAVIQAAWTRVLASYLGENSVVFGVTLSGRTTDETRDAPFPCLNTVPIVASNMASNAELAAYMMEYNQNLYKHQFSPLTQVQQWLGHPARSVFDTLLAYQRMEHSELSIEPWNLVEEEAMVEYPVSLEIEPTSSDEVRFCITYYSDVLPRGQAQLMIKQFDSSLVHIASNPNGHEDDTYANAPELFSILPAASPTLPAPVKLLHQFVEKGALAHPTKTALEFVSGWEDELLVKQTWSYHELDCMGNKVANILTKTAAPGSIIAIHFDKCPEAYFSILGILKAGCSFVALDPTAPKARKQFILQDSKAPCLLTKNPTSLDFKAAEALVIPIDGHSLRGLVDDGFGPKPDVASSDTCYCLYTSGTTGTPKGCEITHENAVQAMMAFQELFKGHWQEDSRWLQFAALHFDVSVLEQYWSWSVGMTVVAAPKDLILDDLTATINRLEITHIDLTPSLARLTHPDEIPSLCRGVFITGGEQLKQEILDIWGPKAVIYNAYGPTEATIGVTMYQRVPVTGRPSNIGKQFPNVGSYVFRQGTETPVVRGGVGELCVSGKLVGKGYLNRDELTKERFPTPLEFNERIYRTGDLVRMLHDGCFDFLGRADDQVKLRGQRLEIAEINHAIRTGVEEIQDTATIVTPHGASGKDVLVSFIIGQYSGKGSLRILPDDQGLGAKAKEACRERLPGYMVPTYIFALPYIPLSPNNKAEVKDLKKLFGELTHQQLMELSRATASSTSPAATEIMNRIVGVLAEFSDMNPDDLATSTSIFDIGVDSITSLRLSSLLKTRGLPGASPAVLLKHPIIADLANALTKATATQNDKLIREAKQVIQAFGHRHRRAVCHALGVKFGDIEYIAPCSPLQQGIISRTMTSENQDIYFNTFELQLRPDTSVEQLRAAWDDLVRAEAILRTAFVSTTEGFIQAALRNLPLSWRERSFGNEDLAQEYLQEEKESWIRENASHIATPLLLTHVTTPTSRRLIIMIFHALYDGNSFELMMERVSATYHHKAIPQNPSFLETLVHGPLWRYDSVRPFWEKHLHDWASARIPRLISQAQHDGIVVTREFSATPLEAIRSFQNVTLQAVVLAAWASVLYNCLSSPATIGVIVSGRAMDLAGVANTIGPLFNTVPFFSANLHKQTWESLIRQCHDFNSSLLEFQHVPLKDIQKWCSGGRALFDNLFAFQIETPQAEINTLWKIVNSSSTPDYPLALEVIHTCNGNLRLTLAAQGHIANSSQLEDILDHFKHAVSLMRVAQNDDVTTTVAAEPSSSQQLWDEATLSIPVDHVDDFTWTEQALSIQHEIALLADVSPQEVNETVTVLELGLDSIDVIKLSAKLRRRSINLPPSQIMRCQNIPRMISEMKDTTSGHPNNRPSDGKIEKIKRSLWAHFAELGMDMDNVETILPPTPLQESMVAGMIQSNFESYFNHDILEIAEAVEIEKFQNAWKEVIRRSPTLRTSFFEVEGGEFDITYCQVVAKPFDIEIQQFELNDVAETHRIISESKQLAREGGARRNLVQLRLLSVGTRKFLSFSIAHALYDGWSLSLLFQDVYDAYDGNQIERTVADGFLASISEAEGVEAEEFWAQYLEGATPTLMAKSERTVNGDALQRQEMQSTFQLTRITDFCKQQSVSLQVLCQACWAVVLARRVQSLDVTFGVVVSGRDFEGTEGLMFPTMNTIALRCILHASPATFLRYLEENMGDIRQYQHYPLRKAQLAATVQAQPLFNTLFILQRSPGSLAANEMLKSIGGSSATEYPICVEAEALDDSLIWRIACQPQYMLDSRDPATLLTGLDNVMQFFMTSKASDVLSFEERGVSICGTPPVMIQEDRKLLDVTADGNETFEEGGWSEIASEIREVLKKVSNVPISSIKKSDTLYHLGLDSISAIKISSILRKRKINLRPQDLIKATSIANMVDIAQTPITDIAGKPATPTTWTPPDDLDIEQIFAKLGTSKDRIELFPALPMQVYMLSAWQNAEGSVFYPEFQYSIDTQIEREAIQVAWDKLVSECPLLRTCFIATGARGIPFLQAIFNHCQIPLDIAPSADESTTGLWPLVTACVTKQEGRKWTFVLRIHHALYDGISIPEIMQRFSSLLRGEEAASLESGISQWREYTASLASSIKIRTRREFWTKYLGNCKTDFEEGSHEVDVRKRTSYLQRSAVPNVAHLQKFAAEKGISFQSLFLASYARILASSAYDTVQATVVFGIYLANRTAAHGLPSTYPTLNLVPLRVETAMSRPIQDVAAGIQKDIHVISSPDLADVGLWEISAWTGIKITSFVNFLSLPNTTNDVGEIIHLLPADATRTSVVDEHTTFHVDPWLQNNAVKADFPVSYLSTRPILTEEE